MRQVQQHLGRVVHRERRSPPRQRPTWNQAAPGPVAEPLVDAVVEALRERGLTVGTGVFGAHMDVNLTNDGPVTILLEA